MARFEVKGIPVACPADGSTDFFKHSETVLTCNKCGHTVETAEPAEVLIEQVVQVSNN